MLGWCRELLCGVWHVRVLVFRAGKRFEPAESLPRVALLLPPSLQYLGSVGHCAVQLAQRLQAAGELQPGEGALGRVRREGRAKEPAREGRVQGEVVPTRSRERYGGQQLS